MKKLTRKACTAFLAGDEFARHGIEVHHDDGTARMYHDGRLIAECADMRMRVTLAGDPPATRAQLNGLLELLNVNKKLFESDSAQFIGSTIARTACEITAHEWVTL